MTLAFMVKMGAAVAVGGTSRRPLFASVTGAGVFWVALKFWRARDASARSRRSLRPKPFSCRARWYCSRNGTILDSSPLLPWPRNSGCQRAVWIGAVTAMLTKGLLAATLGARIRLRLRHQLAPHPVIYGTLALLLLIGGFAVAENAFRPALRPVS